MTIWVNKDQSDVHVGVRTWWMEKVPGHGVGRAEEMAGRPARRSIAREMIAFGFSFGFSFVYPPIPFLKSIIGRF